jgi:hypothetical protein
MWQMEESMVQICLMKEMVQIVFSKEKMVGKCQDLTWLDFNQTLILMQGEEFLG